MKIHYPGKVKYILNYLDKIEKSNILDNVVILYHDVKQLKMDFFSQFKIVEAAGGLVLNPKGKGLFIFRRGHWDLPKGKMEEGESKKETALREVMEETGLANVSLISKLTTTYHIYRLSKSNRRVLKPTYWYLMNTSDKDISPQVEEDIEAVDFLRFHTKEDLEKLSPIYTNILMVVKAFMNQMN